jgi:hypothetical protein
VAYFTEEVENADTDGVNVRTVCGNRDVGRLRATSMVKGFADAILLLLVGNSNEGGLDL